MSERDLFIDYRLRVIALGLVASWIALGAFAVLRARDHGITDEAVLFPLSGMGPALIVLTLVPWRKILAIRLADGLILVWCCGAIVGMLLTDGFRAGDAVVAAFLATVVFASAVLVTPIVVAVVGTAATAGYVAALLGDPVDHSAVSIVLRVLAFAIAAFLLLLAARGIREQMRTAAQRLAELTVQESELTRREGELERLYEISRMIGYGSNLSDVLPELVGRVMHAVGAGTGLVLLYQNDTESLEVISPIWVNGQTVRVEGYAVPLANNGIAQRVFTSCTSAVENDLGREGADAFLAELDADRVAAVPLQIESRAIGVLLAADKADGDFNEADIQLLESLAGPSALVLDHMARYEEAKETGEKMAELARLKTDFVSVVSHELRTPLTSIIGSLKTLQRPELAPTDPNAIELLTTAERQGQRLRALIEDLLVVSRIDNQALPVRPEVIDLERLLEEVITDVPGARPVVQLDVADDVEKIWVDANHLGRVVRNLIENALKYAPGSIVDVTARRRGTEIWMAVADHGQGIPYELHDHIFDRFTQVDRHETRGMGGTGLGLSIVRGLTEAMGGRVWFEPTEGGGATFMVAMRARAGTRAARPEGAPAASVVATGDTA